MKEWFTFYTFQSLLIYHFCFLGRQRQMEPFVSTVLGADPHPGYCARPLRHVNHRCPGTAKPWCQAAAAAKIKWSWSWKQQQTQAHQGSARQAPGGAEKLSRQQTLGAWPRQELVRPCASTGGAWPHSGLAWCAGTFWHHFVNYRDHDNMAAPSATCAIIVAMLAPVWQFILEL